MSARVVGFNADLLDGQHASAFAAASHTHATADVVSGTFADARIAQSNVTQHQAALSIAASQVTAGTFGAGSYIFQNAVTAGGSVSATGSFVLAHAGADLFAQIIGPVNRSLRFVLQDNTDDDAFEWRNAADTVMLSLPRTGILTLLSEYRSLVNTVDFLAGAEAFAAGVAAIGTASAHDVRVYRDSTLKVTFAASLTTFADNILASGDVEIDGALNHDGSTVGFYGTAPVAQQTGVAVDAAGIHAALVNLGLITA